MSGEQPTVPTRAQAVALVRSALAGEGVDARWALSAALAVLEPDAVPGDNNDNEWTLDGLEPDRVLEVATVSGVVLFMIRQGDHLVGGGVTLRRAEAVELRDILTAAFPGGAS